MFVPRTMSDMKIITMNILRTSTYEEIQYPGLNTFVIKLVPNPLTEYKLVILLNKAPVIWSTASPPTGLAGE